MRTRFYIALTLILAVALPAVAQQKQGVAVTVYNGGYGVVRELRSLDVPEGGVVKFTDVARRIDPTTVHFKSLTDPAAKLLEQNYQYDLVSADKLLRKYIDKPIEVICEGKQYAGMLLSFDSRQIVLKEAEGLTMIQRADNVRDIRFKVLPEGLLTRPTLVWLVHTAKPGKHMAEVTYQTNGVGWHAEYVMVVNADDTAADLSGWVSFDNKSGKTYTDAKLKFIAGDVRRVAPEPRSREYRLGLAKGGEAPMEEKAFFEYHMYTLQRPSTVADNEVKQLEMFAPVSGMKVIKKYLYDPLPGLRWYGGTNTSASYGVTSPKKVRVFIEFQNSKENKLGIPLPAGKVRVFKQDPEDKAMEFVGEEQIDHTPKDEKLELYVGNAFDIVGEFKQTGFRVNTSGHWMEEKIEIKVRNHKKEDITVRVKQPMHRTKEWEITAKSHEHKKLDAFNVAFDVPVKADGEIVVTYTVEYRW
ncbi:MAG TPA: DUF4139 domain-containing protein [Phycisphaerae bacterium]|nr:DUF4139 domain-containing protein [Phycisphaerae bacterium]